MKKILLTGIFIVIVTAIFAQDEFTLVKIGSKAPDFTYELQPGQTQTLSGLEGKVVLINFFATWCGPCRMELPHLQSEVYDKYKNNPGFVLLILGREHTWEEVNKFKTENKFTMPFYPDAERKVFSKYAGQNIPRNFIIDKTGKIVYASVGFTEKEFGEMKRVLEGLLK